MSGVKAIRTEYVEKLPLEEKEKKVLTYLVRKMTRTTLHIEEKAVLGYLVKKLLDSSVPLQELAQNLGVAATELERAVRTYERRSDLQEKVSERLEKIYRFYFTSGT